jgi:3-carboxy-cis,cis-muconate cycloisomerase
VNALWSPVFGATAVAEHTDPYAWVRALFEVEAALARACARCGVIADAAAEAIGAACSDLAATDPADLGRRAAADGNPVLAVVADLRARTPQYAPEVHRGATSQDVVDSAAMLVAHRALGVVTTSVDAAAASCRRLAREHRDTPMIGRTLLQQAVPTTFGAVVAGWGEGLDRASASVGNVRAGLSVQLGGAAGTLASLHPHGPAVRAALAEELGLRDPGTVWHTERSRIAELAGALGTLCGALAKIATDIVLLAQTELAEVAEAAGGASSAMPHKHNPIAAVTARAVAAQAPGLVATLLAAMPAELQRGAGPWHTEWQPLTALLDAAGGAADRVATSLTGLRVDTTAMARNLARGAPSGRDADADTGHAGDLVDHYLAGHPE